MFRRLTAIAPGAGRFLRRPVRILALAAAGFAIAMQAGVLTSPRKDAAPTTGGPSGFTPSPVILGTRG
jgi:hypothetical protein